MLVTSGTKRSFPHIGTKFVNNYGFFYPLNFMKRLILICCASMVVSLCHAQISGLLHPAISNFVFERRKLVTDFTYSLRPTNRVLLSWNIRDSQGVEYFSIERSQNGKDFEMIETLRLTTATNFQLVDESPSQGRNFYRIRVSLQGKPIYSETLNVYIGTERPFRFYPNPADNILIIRCDVPLDVQIADVSGEIKISQMKIQGLQTLNVANLEKGIYTIRFTNKITNTISTERLFKN